MCKFKESKMSNINVHDFVRLMNEEYSNFGLSETFMLGQETILKAKDPFFLFECAKGIKGIDILAISTHFSKFDIDEFISNNDTEFAIKNYIDMNKKMCLFTGANVTAHIKNLLGIKELAFADLSFCLNMILTHCMTTKTKDKSLLCSTNFDENAIMLKLINNEKVIPEIRFYCFERLTRFIKNKQKYVAICYKLVDEFEKLQFNEKESILKNLKQYIKQANKEREKQATNRKLSNLIEYIASQNSDNHTITLLDK